MAGALAERHDVIPVLIDRQDIWSGNPRIAMTNCTHREWVYRPAFDLGRHIIGYEVQKVLSLVDWFRKEDAKSTVGVAPQLGNRV